MIAKVLGKIFAYLGNLVAIAGLVWDNIPLFLLGVVILIVGCIMHEFDEK